MNVTDLKLGVRGKINYLKGDDKLIKRLLALGFIEGTEIFFKNIAPFGDPVILNLRGFDLAIRKKDARHIHVMEI